MRAFRLDKQVYLALDEPDPIPRPDEGLIRLRLAGICHTDLELTHGYKGFQGILGHEFVGELLTDAGEWRAGQRVVGEINVNCGQCDFCRLGIPSQCRHRAALGIVNYPGAFADKLRLPIRNLYRVPDSIPDRVAVFTEPLAAALQVTQLVHICPGDRVILVGAGKLGLLIAQVLKLTGCKLTVLARQARPLELLEKWGIEAIDIRYSDPVVAIGSAVADIVVDCTGNAEGLALALNLVRPRGTIVLKSTYAGLPSADLSRIVVDEIRIVGSRCGPFPAALQLMRNSLVDVESMIDAVYSLDEAVVAFEHAARHGVLKILLTP